MASHAGTYREVGADDDVQTLLDGGGYAERVAVREDRQGRVCEKAATVFDTRAEAVYGEAAGAEMSAAFTRAVAADDGTRDTVEAADALGDLTYVVYGMAAQYGIDIDACFKEVHASNMSKLGEDGKPIYRADGKVLKGKNSRKPNLEQFIK